MARTAGSKNIKEGTRVAAAALLDMGVSSRKVGEQLGISHEAALQCARDPYLNKANIEEVKTRFQDRLIVTADRFLTQSIDGLNKLDPYRAMICSGIAHDHYLRSKQSERGSTGSGGLTQILIQIDQSQRITTTSSDGEK